MDGPKNYKSYQIWNDELQLVVFKLFYYVKTSPFLFQI